MRIIMSAAALALLSPTLAIAQIAGSNQPVAVEIVATGELDVAATKLTMTISFTEQASSQAAADKARDAKMAKVLQVLKAQGLTSSALSALSDGEMAKVTLASMKSDDVSEEDGEDAATKDPTFSATEGKKLTLGSPAKAETIKAALEKLDVTVGSETADLDEASLASAQREAKAKALRAARADAEVYAKEMGLRVNRVVRISEAGNGLFLPGLQNKIEGAISKGPQALAGMFKPAEGAVRVEKGLIVEFELTR